MKSRYFLFVLVISLFSHLLFFGHPNDVVFDEVFYGSQIQNYFTGEYYFDVHPPLGKLLIASAGKMMGFSHFHDYGKTDQRTYSTEDYLMLRLLPLVLGIFLGPLIYLVARELLFSESASLLSGIFVSVDGALITESHYILINIILVVFGFLAVFYFLKFRNSLSSKHLIASGILAGCAISVKWTGLGFWGVIAIFYLLSLARSETKKGKANVPLGIFSLIAIPIILYFSVFAVHFWLLKKTGTGANMHTLEFQQTLASTGPENNLNIKSSGVFAKFVEENSLMLSINKKTGARHDFSSKWYSWPFLGKPILYWGDLNKKMHQEIRLIGNPVIWWSGFLAIMIMLGFFLLKAVRRLNNFRENKLKKRFSFLELEFAPFFILTGFLVNWIPFIFIHRFIFLYAYFPALLFSILALGYVIDKMKNNKKILLFLYFEAVLFFLILLPFTYGMSYF